MSLQSASFSTGFITHFRQFWSKWAIFWKTDLFLKKYENFAIFYQNSLKTQEVWLATNQNKEFQKKSISQFFLFFSKKAKNHQFVTWQGPKIPKYCDSDNQNALIGGKNVKTQLLRRRGHRKIQNESYLTSKKLLVNLTFSWKLMFAKNYAREN